MELDYLTFCSYQKTLTPPPSCWYRGTAFQFDVMKDRQTPAALTDLGTEVVMITMAARIMQSVISLGKNLRHKRAWYWKMLPCACMSKVLRAVLWVCWSVVDLLLPFMMTAVYVYKDHARFKTTCDAEKSMNTVTVECHWGRCTDQAQNMIVEELYSLKMEAVQEFAKMEVDCKCEEVINKKDLLPSCRNPVILSMICMPSRQVDSSEESEEDSVGRLEEDCSQEDMSVDSGMQESWTPQSKCEEDSAEESDWSDEDSWDEESNSCNEEDLWASFCRNDDPYNPFSFAMPTRSLEQPMKEAPIKRPETHQILSHLDCTKVVKTECETSAEKSMKCKKPVLSAYKSSHKCTLPQEQFMEESDPRTKKVRFSHKVTVHPIITWSFAHRMARKGPWEEYARDRSRFQRRIAETEAAIGFCLDAHHREKIWARLHCNQN